MTELSPGETNEATKMQKPDSKDETAEFDAEFEAMFVTTPVDTTGIDPEKVRIMTLHADLVADKVAVKFKSGLTGMNTRLKKVETEQKKLAEQQADTDEHVAALHEKLAEQGESIKELMLWKSEQSSGVFTSRLKAGKTKSARADFEDMVSRAREMRKNYTMGKIKDWIAPEPEEGDMPATQLPPDIEDISNFLESCETPTTFTFEIESVEQNDSIFKILPKEGFQDNFQEIKDALGEVGWWIKPSAPNDLRRMEGRAVSFLKGMRSSNKKFTFLPVKDGHIWSGNHPLHPVFLIPEDQEKWPKLFDLIIGSVGRKTWVEKFMPTSTADKEQFIKDFAKEAGLEDLV